MLHPTIMYDCAPCGERCENRWYCLHGSTCLRDERKKLPRPAADAHAQVPTVEVWQGGYDNED